jgi:hypothetical protein
MLLTDFKKIANVKKVESGITRKQLLHFSYLRELVFFVEPGTRLVRIDNAF